MFELKVYGTVKVFSDEVNSVSISYVSQFLNWYCTDEVDFEHLTKQFEPKPFTVIKNCFTSFHERFQPIRANIIHYNLHERWVSHL